VIVLGLDGFDPELARQYMSAGRLPNLSQLASDGCFHSLRTACPSISPVAWSTFATGVDASRHNIYDFLTRDPCSYAPMLSSSDIRTVPRTLNLGFARDSVRDASSYPVAAEEPAVLEAPRRVARLVVDHPRADHVPAAAVRERDAACRACACPDLQGTQGSFSFYSTRERPKDAHIGGQQFQITVRKGVVESNLQGTARQGRASRSRRRFAVELDETKRRAKITVGDETVEVGPKEYTPWLVVAFGGITGIVRFYVQTWEGSDFELYATPIQINPDKPAMPISHPFVYSIYLAKLLGPFGTLGLAEDTWALNEARDRRGRVPRAGVALLRRAQETAVGRDGKDEEGFRHRRVRHERSHQPHVLSHARSDAPRPTRVRKSSATRRDRRHLREDGRARRRSAREDREREGHGADGDQRPRLHELPPRREPQHVVQGERLPRAEGRTRDVGRLVRARRLGEDEGVHARTHRRLHQSQGPRAHGIVEKSELDCVVPRAQGESSRRCAIPRPTSR
jgi:hypothetical protein